MHLIGTGNKKKRAAIRFALYLVLGLIIFGITVFTVLAAQGFDVDRSTGQVIRNGLILVDSEPVAADIYINGNSEDDRAPGRLPLPEGSYTIGLRTEGYEDWSRKVNLGAFEVLRMDYARLIPTDIQSEEVDNFQNPGIQTQNPINFDLLIQRSPSARTFNVYDTSDPSDSPGEISIPSTVITGLNADSRFKEIEWSIDGRKLLLEHTNGSLKEFIVFDVTNPSNSKNVEKLIGASLQNVEFTGSDTDKLVTLINGKLRNIDLDTRDLSDDVATSVIDFEVVDEGFVVARRQASSTVIEHIEDDRTTVLISYASTEYDIELFADEYERDDHLVVWNKTTSEVTMFENPYDTAQQNGSITPDISILREGIVDVSVSPEFRTVMSKNGTNIFVYDREYGDLHSFAPQGNLTDDFEWVDDFRLAYVSEGLSRVIDFDGSNNYELVSSSDSPLIFDKDQENMFYFVDGSGTSRSLRAASLVAEN